MPADALSRRVDHEPAATGTRATKPTVNLIALSYAMLASMRWCGPVPPSTALKRSALAKPDESDDVRQRHRDAAETNTLVPDPTLPPPDKSGTIVTPTQRCTADTAKGKQCGQRTAVGHLCWNHLQRDKGLRVKMSTIKGAGRGLFASRDLKKGFDLPYTGDIITGEDAALGGNYLLELSKTRVVDAARRNSTVARFVNDPHRGSARMAGR